MSNDRNLVVGMDPGLAKMGLVITDLDLNLKAFHCLVTRKDPRLSRYEDNFKRSQHLMRQILDVITSCIDKIALFAVESYSAPRHAASASMLSRSWGILAAIAEQYKIPVTMVQPKDIKKAITGRIQASKSDMEKAIRKMGYKIPELSNKSLYEHPIDALSAIIASKNTQIFRTIKRN